MLVALPKYDAPLITTVSPVTKFLPPFVIFTFETVGTDEPSNVILKVAPVPVPEVVKVETSNTPPAPPVPPETLVKSNISFLLEAAKAALIVFLGKVFEPGFESLPELET